MYPPFFPPLTPLAARLAQSVGDLCRAISARAGRDHSLIPLVNLAWARLIRTVMRFDRLVLRIAAGRPAPVRRAGPKRPRPAPDVPAPEAASVRLPRKFCWLVAQMQEAASFASQIRHLLDDPHMAALLAADLKAAAILRPMCRMLGIAHPSVGTREPASCGPRRSPPRDNRSEVALIWAALAGPVPVRVDGPAFPDPALHRRFWRRSD